MYLHPHFSVNINQFNNFHLDNFINQFAENKSVNVKKYQIVFKSYYP